MRQGANVAIQLLDSVTPLLNLAPVPGLQVVWKGFKGLWDLVQQVQEGRSQLELLSGSVAVFLHALDQKLQDNESLAALIEGNLEPLLGLIEEISEFARKQADKPFLKRLLQGDEVTATVTKYHQRLLHVYNVFNLSCELDIKLWQSQFEDARRHDKDVLERLLQQLMKNQDRLFNELFGKIDVQQTSILAAMSAMQKNITRLNADSHRSTERHFLQHSVSILQRKSGRVVKTESWTVSSFEVDKGEKLGSGGFSTVYKAMYLGAPVAVKELVPTTSSKMLMNEIAVWEGLRHPNILQFMGASVYEEPPFIIMELMINGNALDYIRDKPTTNRVLLIHQISLGLVYLHTRNIIHGDLKATNVLIKADNTAVIADFRLSMIKLDVTSRSTTVLVSGTKRWMSPERMKGKRLANPVDIYAWAMTAYEIFTGLVPFGPTDESLLYELVVREEERPERPEVAEVGLTDAIWSLMERSWLPNPHQRPSASDIRDETIQFIRSPSSDPVAKFLPSLDVEQTPTVPYSLNNKSTTIVPRQSLAAVSVGERLLLYIQNDIGLIREFRCDGSPAEVVRGHFGPFRWLSKFKNCHPSVFNYKYLLTFETRLSVPGSGIAAFGLLNNHGDLLVRLYIQERSYALRELVPETGFQNGLMKAETQGLAGTSIAAVTSLSVAHFHIFYQGADGAIYGKLYRARWQPIQKIVNDVMPLTALSVVSTNDLKKTGLYYQESGSTVREQHGIWSPGFKFPIDTPTTTRIATVEWSSRNSSLYPGPYDGYN